MKVHYSRPHPLDSRYSQTACGLVVVTCYETGFYRHSGDPTATTCDACKRSDVHRAASEALANSVVESMLRGDA